MCQFKTCKPCDDSDDEICFTCGLDYDECSTCDCCPNDAKCAVLCRQEREAKGWKPGMYVVQAYDGHTTETYHEHPGVAETKFKEMKAIGPATWTELRVFRLGNQWGQDDYGGDGYLEVNVFHKVTEKQIKRAILKKEMSRKKKRTFVIIN